MEADAGSIIQAPLLQYAPRLKCYFVNLDLKLLLPLSLSIQELHEVHLVKAKLTGTAVYSIACQ